MASLIEGNTTQSGQVSSSEERMGETDTPNRRIGFDSGGINDRIVNSETILILNNTTSDIRTGSTQILSPTTTTTNSSNTNRNEGERHINAERRMCRFKRILIPVFRLLDISEWKNDEVQGWFQSHRLMNLYNSLFARDDSKDGRSLAKIFEFKLKNYERYRVFYTSRLPPNQSDLLKDFDRFGQLLDSYFIDKYAHRFDVAFSFPGEVRDKVSQIAERLCAKVNRDDGKQRIFYDKYHQAELARPNLDLYLHTVYRYQTRLIVVFMCDDYSRKEWCGLESRAIRSLLKTYQNDRIMLLSIDGKTIDGVLDIDGYLDISNMNVETIVDKIYERLISLGDPLSQSQSLYTPTPIPTRENVVWKSTIILKNIFRSISPWYIVVALSSYILGTFIRR